MKRIFTVILLLLPFGVWANSEYQQWLQQTQQEFDQYLSEQDQAFSQFMKESWVKKDMQTTPQRDTEPKPVTIPKADKAPIDDIPKIEPPKAEPPKPIAKPEPKPEPKPKQKQRSKQTQFEFLGQPIALSAQPNIADFRFYQVNNNNIAKGFEHLARTPYKTVVNELEQYQTTLQLDNWAQANLIHRFAQNITRDSNKQTLITWFYLMKTGFDVRLAHDKRNLILLVASDQAMYEASFFTFSGQRYYTLKPASNKHGHGGAVYTYKQQHQEANKRFTIIPKYSAKVAGKMQTRTLSYGENRIDIPYSQEYIELLDTYPQLDMSLYFDAQPPQAMETALLEPLKLMVADKSPAKAAQLLLNFMHNAFPYKTDAQQFQRENYLLPSETLYYPYSDCEDRSALFAYLVKNVLNLDTIGLLYNGHVAVAIAVSGVSGDTISHKGKQYVVADPTYINASLGMTMPQYKRATPKIIEY
ncbi:hypothetical protein [Bermanella sp. R86510]|uniref:hypothetical protein n=1 Tax=unclassified Bermanella TaxID=2627862 RepID=UPI0037C741C1